MLISMAFKNIFRHTKRTILTLITIVAGIYMAMIGDGLNSGLKWQLADIYIKTDSSSFRVYSKGFYDGEEKRNPLEYLMENEKEAEEIVKNDKDTIAYSKRLVFPGSVTNGRDELRANFIGVSADEENRVYKRKEYMQFGKFLETGDVDKVVVGKEFATVLGLKVGDFITISCRTKTKAMNALDVEIKGIIKTGNPIIDGNAVFMPREYAAMFADTDKISEIVVLSKVSEVKPLLKKLERMRDENAKHGLEAFSWYDETKDLMKMVEFRERVFSIITVVILLMAAAGVANTMLMAMLERKREIGIMMANGMEKGKILRLFLYEGVIIGMIGSAIAFVMGAVVVNYLQVNGLKLPIDLSQFSEGFPIADRFYFHYNLPTAILFFCVGVVVAAAAAFYPASKATKLEPVEAIRG